MKAPLTFRVQVDKMGASVVADEIREDAAVGVLVHWASEHEPELVRAIFREWAGARLNEWLKARSVEAEIQTPGEQMILALFGDMPLRIEVGPARFVNLLDADRGQLRAWRKQAQVKADNVTGYADRVGRAVEWLVPQLTDDQMTVRAALASVTEGPIR